MASTSRDQEGQLTAQTSSSGILSSSSREKKNEYLKNYDFFFCDESNKYEKVAKIGQGTFG